MDNEELDILHRLYKLDKDYSTSFEILIKMKSPLAFHYFDTVYQGFDQEASLRNNLSKLL